MLPPFRSGPHAPGQWVYGISNYAHCPALTALVTQVYLGSREVYDMPPQFRVHSKKYETRLSGRPYSIWYDTLPLLHHLLLRGGATSLSSLGYRLPGASDFNLDWTTACDIELIGLVHR